MGKVPVYDIDALPTKRQGPFTHAGIRSSNTLVTFITSEPTTGPLREPHRHPFDQVVILVKGEFEMEINNEIYHLKARSSMVVPAGAWHRGNAVGNTRAELIEIFTPIRKDYVHLTDHQNQSFEDAVGVDWFVEGDR